MSIVSLEQVEKEWEEDANIALMEYDTESIKTPKLLSKYMNYMRGYKKLKVKLKSRLDQLERDKRLYYDKKAPPEAYKDAPFDFNKIAKSDLPIWVKADEEYQEVREQLEIIEFGIWYIEQILWEISRRRAHIANAIEWVKYTGQTP